MFKRYFNLLKFTNYEENKDRVNMENRTGIALILVFYSFILILNIISTIVSRKNVIGNRNLMLELIYMLITVPLYFYVLRKKDINFTALIYAIEVPMLLISIYHGTFDDPGDLTFTFLLFLLILPLLILDKPKRVILFIVVITAVYAIADVIAKDPEIYVKDLMHAFNAGMMSIAASLYVLSVRIQNNTFINIVEDKADRDPLTGLYNRFGAEHYFKKNEPGLLMYMDLDRFKDVNDSLGHGEGDRILQETANVLKSSFRKGDILIRMGGDEFAVFASGKWSEEAISRKLSEVLKKVENIHAKDESKNIDIGMSVSIGCVYASEGAMDIDELIRYADRKMYDVTQNGKANFKIVNYETAVTDAA